MKVMFTKSLMKTLIACGLLVCIPPATASAQVVASPNDSVEVTGDESTWLVAAADNAVNIPAGADGVVINNGAGGRIVSQAGTGVNTSADTEVNNDGLIEGGTNGVNFVNGQGSGSLRNGATGVVSSNSRAVNIGGSVALRNDGAIVGTGDQRNGTVYSDSVAQSFSIDNRGSIDAGEGNQGSGLGIEVGDANTATVRNSGSIQGRTNRPGVSSGSGASADGLRLANFGSEGTFSGSIENTSGATIRSESESGTTAGLRVADGIQFKGQLDNSGEISGARNGVYFGDADHAGGVVNNRGTISSGSRALNVDGSGLEINNSSLIVGTGDQRNGTVYADSTAQDFTLNNAGEIDAGLGNQGAGFSVELSEAGNDFTINNLGSITGRGNASAGAATAGDGIRLERGRVNGALDGSTTGRFTGTINNAALIASDGENGTVAGFRAVNGVDFQGELNNTGLIEGLQNGVYFGNPTPAGGGDHTGGVVNNSGVIASGSRALNIDGRGLEINNSGFIEGTGDQRNGTVYADSTAQDFTLNNAGTIDAGTGNQGAGFSVELNPAGSDFSITNSGTIAGRGNASAGAATAGDGIRLERARVNGALDGSTTGLFTGTISNAGTISSDASNGTVGGFRAVNGVDFQGTLNNSGTISGVQNGVYFGNATPAGGGDHTGGVVNNSGSISSDSRAFNVDGNGLTVNNTGDIFATGRQRNGTLYVDGTADNFEINNLGTIDALDGAGSGVSVQVGATQSGNINNNGVIAGNGDQAVDAGVRFFTNEASAVFTGDISNQFGGFITGGENAEAVLFGDNVSFNGSLINDGQIFGGIDLNDGTLELTDNSFLSLEINSLTDFDSVSADTILFDGTLELVFGEAFEAEAGDFLDLFTFNSAGGTLFDSEISPLSEDFFSSAFDEVITQGLEAQGLVFSSANLGSQGRVSFVSASAVPEPSAMAALLFGSLGCSIRRRRRA